MRVGLDVTATTTGGTGVARYARELATALAADVDVEVVAFAFGRGQRTPPSGTRRLRIPRRVLVPAWRAVGWPRAETVTGPVDLVHVLDLAGPPTRRPTVMTVHDVAAVDLPDLHPAHRVAAQLAQIAAARRAAVVVAVSAATAAGLARHGVDPAKIAVVHLGCTPLPAPAPARVAPPYLLFVGELTPRKGIDTLLEAFTAADLAPDVRLVLAGPPGHAASPIAGNDRVVVLGAVGDDDLSRLYADATALVLPSRAEGFGLPVLEAMSAGLPVLASDLDVMREVTDGAAVFVDVGDVPGWSEAMRRICADAGRRRELAEAGRTRAARFNWAETARGTVAAYRRALECA